MAGINPLQLPKWETAPQIDWAPLARIGDAIGQYRRKEMMAQAVADATGPDGNVDLNKLGTRYLGAGEVDAGMAAARLADARAQRDYARATDERDFAWRRDEAARAQRNADRRYELDQRILEGGRLPAGFERDPATGGMRPIAGGPADPNYKRQVTDRQNAPAGYKWADPSNPDAGLVPIAGGPAEKVDAEVAARLGLGRSFLDQLPAIRQRVKSGEMTGPIDAAMGYLGAGAPGELRRQIDSGAEALLRNLTGAGMSQTEAAQYVRRYQFSPTDTAETAGAKLDQLERELRYVMDTVGRGRGGSLDRAPPPGTARQPDRPAASAAPAQPAATFDERFTGGPPRAEVRPSAKVWGDREAESAGLYEPRPQAAGRPVQVRTADEARRLPRGTRFIDPNGVERIVP
ncbi:hypothetical protein RHODGE_RHODGE_03977 [Rhodoplanes serenus]|uniref:Uncharacterized protein n=1 Tax=Rhodoplanes serenus TaxID=200615 RepID=A0A3S4BII8_9BRAD|nr:hypothetical protein [Rhodoplanes serenus]VCU10773.1 hypothetical protein RHODGE_RHODGE_03977 [Rhodoplanes serenus]